MGEAWLMVEEAAAMFGYTRWHLNKLARMGDVRTRPGPKRGAARSYLFELHALRAYVNRPRLWVRRSTKKELIREWVKANARLWSMHRKPLRQLAIQELGFYVCKELFTEAMAAAGAGGPHNKTRAALAWIRAHPAVIYESPIGTWRKYCRDVEQISASVFTTAIQTVKKELAE